MPEHDFHSSVELIFSQPWLRERQAEYFELLTDCPSDAHRRMVISLLSRTKYVSASEYVGAIDSMRDHVENNWNLKPHNTIFVSSNKEYTDSSQEVLNQLKSSRWTDPDWNKELFFVRYRDALTKIGEGYNVVLVDDFIGSGGSMLASIGWFTQKLTSLGLNAKIRVLSVSGCVEGIGNIRKSDFEIHTIFSIPKGLSDYLTGADLTDASAKMADLEDLLELKIGPKALTKYRFGWKKQEAVFVRHGGNTPNNVFPIFWWHRLKSGVRRTIMHRT